MTESIKEYIKKALVVLLREVSKAVLKKYKPRVVAITGSVGKTQTKEAVYTVLSQFDDVRKSPKNFNTEFGVPLTIIGIYQSPERNLFGWLKVLIEGVGLIIFPNHYPHWLVFEVGTDRPGDIASIASWLVSDVVIITKLAAVPVHVEAFGSPQELFDEKASLIKSLKPDGTLILNGDDEEVVKFNQKWSGKTLYFGSEAENSNVRASNYQITYDDNKHPTGISFEVQVEGVEHIPLKINLPGTVGESHVSHVLAAITVAKLLEKNLFVAAKSFGKENPTPGRMRLIEGVNGSTIIDDTYNSSPIAVEEALNTLKTIKARRKVAVLGDMLELGRYAVEEHRKVGEMASRFVKILVTVGIRSRLTADGAVANGMDNDNVFHFDDSRGAAMVLKEKIQKGDLILIKGSQGVRMERVVEAVMAHPEDKNKLLVRQSAEWRMR